MNYLIMLLRFLMILPISGVAGFQSPAYSQVFNCSGCKIYGLAKGTGNTNGHVINLTLYNPGNKVAVGSIGPFFINGFKNFQPYITTETQIVTIPANDSLTIRLTGWCADVFKVPVPQGEILPPIDTWVSLTDREKIKVNAGNIKMDVVGFPYFAGPIYLDAIERIASVYDSLKPFNHFRTVLNGEPEKERESVIQQSFWIYSSLICNKNYTKEMFKQRTLEQYRLNNKGQAWNGIIKKEVLLGADSLWKVFLFIGETAGLFPASESKQTELIQAKSGPAVKPACNCTVCKFADDFVLIDSATGIQYSHLPNKPTLVRPNSTLIISPPPFISSNCPPECNPTVNDEFFMHDYACDTSILYKSYQKKRVMHIGKTGEMSLTYHAICYCDGKFCTRYEIRRAVKVKENPCCSKLRCKRNKAFSIEFVNKKNPEEKVIIDGNKLIIKTSDYTYMEEFGFNLEEKFCNLQTDEVFSQLVGIGSSYATYEQSSSASLRMNGISKWKEYLGSPDAGHPRPYYGFQFSKKVVKNGQSKELDLTFSTDVETCKSMVQIIIDGKAYEYTAE